MKNLVLVFAAFVAISFAACGNKSANQQTECADSTACEKKACCDSEKAACDSTKACCDSLKACCDSVCADSVVVAE